MIPATTRRAQFARYLVAGAVNTALTYALLVVGMRWIGYLAAYTVAYAAGVFLGYALQSRFVFRVPFRWSAALRFPLVYVVQYLFGAMLLWLLAGRFHSDARVAALVVVIANVPLGFVLSRLVLLRHRSVSSARDR
jgi:putative flippase GtrA